MSVKTIIALSLVTLLAAGCKSTGIKDVTSSVKGMFGAGDRTENLEGTMLEAALQDDNPSEPATQEERQADINYWRYGNRTVGNLPQLQNYCNEVLTRVLQGWKGHPIDAKVYVSPENEFGAFTLPHGSIFISLGTLKTLESEDELAALLGHEVSHLLLHHHGSDSLREASSWVSGALDVYKRSNNQGVSDDFTRARAMAWIVEKTVFPAWARGKENEADALGTDLLVASGYNADAMVRLMKKIETNTLQRKDWLASQPQLTAAPTQQTPSAEAVKQQISDAFTQLGKNLEQQLSAEHDSAAARKSRVRDYLKDKHLQRPHPSFKQAEYQHVFKSQPLSSQIAQYRHVHKAELIRIESNDIRMASSTAARSLGGTIGEDPYTRMFMYEMRAAEGKQQHAEINLNKAYATDAAPYSTYLALLELAFDKHDYVSAQRYLDEIDNLFGTPKELLPMRIRLTKANGQPVEMLRLRCIASANSHLITECNQAVNGK